MSFYSYPYLFGYLFSKGVYAQRDAKVSKFYDDYVSLLRDTGSMMAEEVVQNTWNGPDSSRFLATKHRHGQSSDR
ncbi:hypothetical protein OK016_17655 [Vibrio chagasii]|nr:hypothetical protein [Vibrio chagasii]